VELGKLATAAQPKLLVTSHFVGSGAVKDSVIAAIRRQGSQRRIVIGKISTASERVTPSTVGTVEEQDLTDVTD
jgi:hypothetical protein